ncbi:MAG: formate dehydrogenase subunit gamma [Gammaproteobacteria bacterium]
MAQVQLDSGLSADHPSADDRQRRAIRYRRITLWSLVLIVAASVALPMGAHFAGALPDAEAQAVQDTNPRSNYWRAVRQGIGGYSAVQGNEANILIHNGGQNYRQIRNAIVIEYGPWVIVVVAAAILLFFLVRGRVKLEGGRSGVKVKRWNVFERYLHWFVAATFVALSITGLSLLLGRTLLIPIMTPAGFAAWAGVAKDIHNFVGPAFSIGVALMFLLWIWNNLPARGDLTWFLTGGGMVGKKHPHAGRMNAGEKLWFWFVVIGGGAVIATGLILDFPNVEWLPGTRSDAQLSQLIHGAASIAWIAFWVGHAYIGTLGSEGSLEAMTTGYVDTNWAKQHHDLWFDKVKDKPGALVGEHELSAAKTAAGAGAVLAAAGAGTGASSAGAVPEDSVLRRHYESAKRFEA